MSYGTAILLKKNATLIMYFIYVQKFTRECSIILEWNNELVFTAINAIFQNRHLVEYAINYQ